MRGNGLNGSQLSHHASASSAARGSILRFPDEHIRKLLCCRFVLWAFENLGNGLRCFPPRRESTSAPARVLDRRIGQHTYVVAPTSELGGETKGRRDGAPGIDDGQQETSRRAAAAVVHPVGARQIKVCMRSAGSRSTELRRFGRD